MRRLGRSLAARRAAAAVLTPAGVVSAAAPEDTKAPRSTLFVGLDTSGSFRPAYDDAVTFVAHYLYGHMHELGGLSKPRDLFVTAIGGEGEKQAQTLPPYTQVTHEE